MSMNVAIKLIASTFPEPAELRTGLGIMQVEFSVTSTGLTAGAHKLTWRTDMCPQRASISSTPQSPGQVRFR
jgi:hypothetical protein